MLNLPFSRNFLLSVFSLKKFLSASQSAKRRKQRAQAAIMDLVMFGDTSYDQSLLELPFPTLQEVCVKKIVQDFESVAEGRDLTELTSPKYSYTLGPFSNLGKNAL